MGAVFSYSLASGIVLACLYLAFKATLSGSNQHGYNRGVALSIYAVSFLIFPLKNLMTSVEGAAQGGLEVTTAIPVFTVSGSESHTVWPTVLLWVYLAGMVVVAALTAATWLRILILVCRGERTRHNGFTLVLTDDCHISPFSWMRFVVMSRQDYATYGQTILTHECRHIALCHWLDLLIAQTVIVVGWFNPASWLMRRELMTIHEYQADSAVLESGFDALQYQTILIEKAAGARFPSLANSLNHSNLKKRITMMYEKKSSKGQRLKTLALVPATALALTLTATPSVSAAISRLGNSELRLGKVTENPETMLIDQDTMHIVKSASYEINVDFRDNQTRIRLTSAQFASTRIQNLLLVADGVPCKPQSINTNIDSGVGTIDLNFGQLPRFGNGTLTFDCDGRAVAISIVADGNGGAMNSVVQMSDDAIPANAVVHSAQTLVKVQPGNSDITISTATDNAEPTEQHLSIDQSKLCDGTAYIYNGRQITKDELDALSPSAISSIQVADHSDLKVVLIMDKKVQ